MVGLHENMIYRVAFFKTVQDSTGHPHNCCQGTIDVNAENEESAIASASRRFAELGGVEDWRLRAERAQVEALVAHERVSPSVPPKSSVGRRSSRSLHRRTKGAPKQRCWRRVSCLISHNRSFCRH